MLCMSWQGRTSPLLDARMDPCFHSAQMARYSEFHAIVPHFPQKQLGRSTDDIPSSTVGLVTRCEGRVRWIQTAMQRTIVSVGMPTAP